MSVPETQPLLDEHQQAHNQQFENPVTGQVEILQTISDYEPITDAEDLEDLINDEHQHSRNCNLEHVRQRRKRLMRRLVIYFSLLLFSVFVVLEFFNILTVPFGYFMGSILVIGGMLGFLRKKSVASLVSGSIFGCLFIYSTYISQKNDNMKLLGHDVNLSISVILLITGLIRSYLTRFQSEVPLILFFLGLLSSSYYLFKYFILAKF